MEALSQRVPQTGSCPLSCSREGAVPSPAPTGLRWRRAVFQEGESFKACFRLETPTDGIRCKIRC